jgi:hypothetical protein
MWTFRGQLQALHGGPLPRRLREQLQQKHAHLSSHRRVMTSGAKALAVAIAAPLVIGYAVTQAPQIEITSTSMAHTQQGAIEVKGRVKKRRIAQVFLDVNGYRQPVPVYDQTFRATVPLVPGLNKIRASADKGTWHLTGTSNPIRVVADIPVTYERRAFVEGRWVRVGMGAPNCDCSNVDFGLLTAQFRNDCIGTESALIAQWQSGKLPLTVDKEGHWVGPSCGERGPRAWPIEGGSAFPPQPPPPYATECRASGLAQTCN